MSQLTLSVMSELSENVRQVIVKLVPASVVNDIKCFVFYDKYPSDDKNIDITICTAYGEVREYYRRDLASSIKLPNIAQPSEIKILRNTNCNLFYLVASKDKITILSRKEKLEIHQMVTGVERYDISDVACCGQACLRVFRKADAVPLIFDDNFENFKRPDISTTIIEHQNDDALPIISHLMRKLTEAKYSLKCNEKTYKYLVDLHHNVAFSLYRKIHPNLDDSVFKDGAKEITPTDLIFHARWQLVIHQDIPEGMHGKQIGHRHVCVVCGRSISRISRRRLLIEGANEQEQRLVHIISSWIQPRELTSEDEAYVPCWLRARRRVESLTPQPDVHSPPNSHRDLMCAECGQSLTSMLSSVEQPRPENIAPLLELQRMASALRINTQTPWIKVCNKKIVIVLNVCNLNHEVLEDVHILIHGTTGQSIEYSAKIFEKTDKSPFWEETGSQILKYNKISAIAVVIHLKELKSNVLSKIEFNGVIFYKKNGKECLLPMEDVKLSSLDTMGAQFDVMSSDPIDSNIMLAILATTEKTDLIMRHIKRPNDQALSQDIFYKYLMMERVPHCDNVAIHRKSPYHILNGVMVVMEIETTNGNDSLIVTVYSRTPSQVLALIHYIHDAVPLTIIITTPNIKITAKNDNLSKYNEDIIDNTQSVYNYQNYATSILNRTELVLKYLDHCMVKMGDSKSSVVQNKIGTEIDLFAGGEEAFIEFKKRMRDEANLGVLSLTDNQGTPESEIMCID